MATLSTQPTIFINIAAYNDKQLYATLRSAIAGAVHPERLHFGICWQSDNPMTWKPQQSTGVFWLPLNEAKGVGWARWLADGFYQGEDFYLQLDAHMLFLPGWDEFLIDSLTRQSNLTVFSSYCPGWSEYPKPYPTIKNVGQILKKPNARAIATQKEFNQFGVLRFTHGDKLVNDQVGHLISGHFIFGYPQFWADVPIDPNIFYNGEEISMSVRAWTHGYDVVHLARCPIFHKYNTKSHPVIWRDNKEWAALNGPSIVRVKAICEGRIGDDAWGLGNIRQIADFEVILGIDFENKKVWQRNF